MKYFLIETDEKNRNPYNVNKNQAIDIRKLTRESLDNLPLWNIIEMDFPTEGFFPDLICSPCIFLSEVCMKTVEMYQPDTVYKGMKLWDKISGINATYFLPILEEVDCMSDKTEFNKVGNRIVELVLNREKIGTKVVFKVKGYDKKGIVGRMDFVESILRRNVRGIKLEEILIEEA